MPLIFTMRSKPFFVGREALRSGYGAFFGRVGGFIFKMSLAVAMVVLVSFRLW